MRSIVHEPYFTTNIQRILGPQYELHPRFMAVEWALARETDFTRYPLVQHTPSGLDVRAFKHPPLTVFFYVDALDIVHLEDVFTPRAVLFTSASKRP
jgi:hypothetical protein